jgi:hypothetical protein
MEPNTIFLIVIFTVLVACLLMALHETEMRRRVEGYESHALDAFRAIRKSLDDGTFEKTTFDGQLLRLFAVAYCGIDPMRGLNVQGLKWCIRRQHDPVTTEQGDHRCTICYEDNVRLHAIIPCGHAYCRTCVCYINNCPQCDAKIERTLRLFIDV